MRNMIFVLVDEITIYKESFTDCYNTILKFHKNIQPDIRCPGGPLAHSAKTIDEKIIYAINHFGWFPQLFDIGIGCLLKETDIIRGSEEFLEIIAPFVEDGSSIEYIDEEGDAFKYDFNNGKLFKYTGKINYVKSNQN